MATKINKFRDIVISDLKAYKINIPDNVSFLKLFKHIIYSVIYFPGFACVFLYRINRLMFLKKIIGFKIFGVLRFYLFKNDISFSSEIGSGFRLVHVFGIVIGSKAVVGNNVTILNDVTIGSKGGNHGPAMPTVGDNVFIGSGSKILGEIKIGNNVTIGALTFCDKSLPDNSVAYGNPMIIKQK